jgi:saccharopine dehydrogenase (NAD+, L-glutamate forming)
VACENRFLVEGQRQFDLVLFGATGFTGGLTADYLAANAPEGTRWALVGRNRDKLDAVAARLAAGSAGPKPEIVVADAADREAMRGVAESTRVVVTTVGPYILYGEPLVAACAAAGTDYVDLTGEPEFVDRMYVAHHASALASGARIVHACGFDSIPHDLGAYYAVQQLPDDVPITLRGVVRSRATFSGGTFHSAMTQMSRARQMKQASSARRRAEGRPEGRSSRAVAGKPHRDSVLGRWLLPLPTIDPIVVARSGAALPSYGPDFRYSHYAGTKTLRYALGGAVGLGAIGLAAQVKPVRSSMLKHIKQGEGPDAARRAKSWFRVDFVGEGGGRSVHTRVSGGVPGYDETAKMLAESALSLAFDDNPPTAGQVTTAQAMGDHLIERLQAAGITFEVL